MGPEDDADHYDQWKRWKALREDDSGKKSDFERDGWQGTGFSHHDFDTKYDPYGPQDPDDKEHEGYYPADFEQEEHDYLKDL